MDKNSSNFIYSLNRSKSFLVVVQNLIWENGGKPCDIKVEKPTFAGLSQQGYKTAFIPITLLDGDARKKVS